MSKSLFEGLISINHTRGFLKILYVPRGTHQPETRRRTACSDTIHRTRTGTFSEGNSLCKISVCCVCLTNELNLRTWTLERWRRNRRRMAFKIGKQWLINPEMGDIRSRSQHTISSARFFTRGGDNLLHLWAHDMQNFQLVRASRFWLLLVLRRIKSQIVVLSSPVHEMDGWLALLCATLSDSYHLSSSSSAPYTFSRLLLLVFAVN